MMVSVSSLTLVVVLILGLAGPSAALHNGLGRTPPMGWNSWEHFYCSYNESLIIATAHTLIDSGLAAAGYNYVNLDDCWQIDRDPLTGEITIDPKQFPSGMADLVNQVHALGLKFGLYSDSGMMTCQGRPGGMNYEKIDAATYAKWKIDFLKYDNCYDNGVDVKARYPRMRDALNATGRPIFFSLCEWGVEDPATWAPDVGNSWRTTADVDDNWKSMLSNLDGNDVWWKLAGPYGWNDPDMLEAGNGGMTTVEYTSQFSLWALAKAPLLIGSDITHMSKETFTILTNAEVIALNQDSLGVQGHRVYRSSDNNLEVYAAPLANGDVGVVLLNRGPAVANIIAQYTDIGLPQQATASVRDLWSHSDLGMFKSSVSLSVESHGSRTLRLTPQSFLSSSE